MVCFLLQLLSPVGATGPWALSDKSNVVTKCNNKLANLCDFCVYGVCFEICFTISFRKKNVFVCSTIKFPHKQINLKFELEIVYNGNAQVWSAPWGKKITVIKQVWGLIF